jgi:GGDEF domain-containing protein
LLTNLRDAGAAICVSERVLEALREPFAITKHEVGVSASVGIALRRVDTTRPSDFLRNADTALYQAYSTEHKYRPVVIIIL